MRIAHVITRLIIGGAQENTLLTCEGLMREYGDEVLLVTGPGLGPEGSLVDDARRRNIPMVVLPEFRRAIHPWRDVQSYYAIRRQLRRFQPEVVHTHSGKGGLLGRMAATTLGVPAVVHTVHGAPFHPYQSRGARAVLRLCERYAARRCHAIVSVADAMSDQMVAAHVAPREMFTTVYSGMEVEPLLEADRSRQQLRGKLGYEDHHVVVGKVARFFHLKGHADLIEAASRVVDEFPDLRFLLVGDGILCDQLRKQIEQAGMTDRFQFTGLVPPEEIPPLLGAMDIVVHASLREGLARVLPQALIAARAVISYDIDGAREVVLPGETGFLVAPRDVPAMARAIAALAGDASLRERLGQTGRERFTELFRHQAMTAQLRALYAEILERNRGSSAA